MEMFDIVDENGEPTGTVKERTKVHEDGIYIEPHMYGLLGIIIKVD